MNIKKYLLLLPITLFTGSTMNNKASTNPKQSNNLIIMDTPDNTNTLAVVQNTPLYTGSSNLNQSSTGTSSVITFTEKELEGLSKELTDIKSKYVDSTINIDNLENEKKNIEKELEELKKEYKDIERELEVEKTIIKIVDVTKEKEYINLSTEKDRLSRELQTLKSLESSTSDKLKSSILQAKRDQQSISDKANDFKRLENKYKNLETSLSESEKKNLIKQDSDYIKKMLKADVRKVGDIKARVDGLIKAGSDEAVRLAEEALLLELSITDKEKAKASIKILSDLKKDINIENDQFKTNLEGIIELSEGGKKSEVLFGKIEGYTEENLNMIKTVLIDTGTIDLTDRDSVKTYLDQVAIFKANSEKLGIIEQAEAEAETLLKEIQVKIANNTYTIGRIKLENDDYRKLQDLALILTNKKHIIAKMAKIIKTNDGSEDCSPLAGLLAEYV